MHQTAVVVAFTKPDEDHPYGDAHVVEDWGLNDMIRGEGCEELEDFWDKESDGFLRIREMFKYGSSGMAKVVPMPKLKCVRVRLGPNACEKVADEDWKRCWELFSKISPSDFRLRSGPAYELGKILAGTTFDDLVLEEGDYYPVREWVASLGAVNDNEPCTFYVVQAFDTDP